MAINVSQAFKRTSANPVDESLTLTKAQMLAINDNLQPNKYFAICLDDGELYIYDKSATPNAETGKFKKYGGGHAVEDSEGTALTQRDTMQFGEGLNATDDSENEKTVVEPNLMTAADMDDVVTPLPSVRSSYQKYSTEEQIVGEWIDGKPLYQKTFTGLMPTKTEMESHLGRYWYNFDSIANMDMGMIVNGFYIDKSENLIQAPIYGLINQANGNVNAWSTWRINRSPNISISLLTYANNSLADLLYLTEYTFTDNQDPLRYYITVQYTKTTDAPNT